MEWGTNVVAAQEAENLAWTGLWRRLLAPIRQGFGQATILQHSTCGLRHAEASLDGRKCF